MSEATQTEKKQAQKERKAYRAKKRKLFFKTLFSRKIKFGFQFAVLAVAYITSVYPQIHIGGNRTEMGDNIFSLP